MGVARQLLRTGADVNLTDIAGKTAFAIAMGNGNPELTMMLLEETSVDLQLPGHFLGFNMACNNGNLALVQLLVDQVDLTRHDMNESGFTPLHFACQHNSPQVVKLLLDKGSKIDAKSEEGKFL